MQVETSLQGLKKTNVSSGETQPQQWNYSSVWLPVQTEGKSVMSVTNRQSFMDRELGNWRTIQVSRVAAILFGVGALYFLPSNLLFSAALALAAGWAWGLYTKKAFFFEKINRKREILEGT